MKKRLFPHFAAVILFIAMLAAFSNLTSTVFAQLEGPPPEAGGKYCPAPRDCQNWGCSGGNCVLSGTGCRDRKIACVERLG